VIREVRPRLPLGREGGIRKVNSKGCKE